MLKEIKQNIYFENRKLEFSAQYNAGKIAVINIRDLDGVTNSINVITPDGSKILQCASQAAKVNLLIYINRLYNC